ncbi:Phenazine biosynthesis-like domain-containing protein [Rhynchospora pubera]|uniref:Phenazine biosynthesis-like domain-containing protein n=1 Tax=Rhynchospora pubera TaxID=906938 RepID=A0AAV8FD30_9POAL|nr:Phenazine biosynthesis-like domain-containing protein [Rhynchospora pubera]
MPQRAIKYAVIDAFTGEAFKGNPAAVCLLEETAEVDEHWMLSVAKEFNISETCFLTRVVSAVGSYPNSSNQSVDIPRFSLRWFTPVAEPCTSYLLSQPHHQVNLCGHATLASAHFLFTSALLEHETIEFITKSGLLTAKKVTKSKSASKDMKLFIELDFPADQVVKCNASELPSIPLTLNGLSVVNVLKTTASDDFIVEVSSGKEVAELQPNFMEIQKCAGRGVIVTGQAPDGSGFDFFSRFFCPKLGVNEDPVCGSAHCALVPYWSRKLQKKSLTAFMASPRSGVLHLELDEKSQRVRISGEAVTVMVGTLLV